MKQKTFAEMLKEIKNLFPIKKECYEFPHCKALDADWFVSGKDEPSRQIGAILQKVRIKPHILDGINLDNPQLPAEELEQVKKTLSMMQKAFPQQIGTLICSPILYQEKIKSVEFDNVCCIATSSVTDILKDMYKQPTFTQDEIQSIRDEAFSNQILHRWTIKKYKYLIVYGDALVSGIYAAYAAHEIKSLYGEEAGIIIVQHHEAGKRKDSLAAKQMLEQLGTKVINIVDDEDLEDLNGGKNLLFVPQHRVIYAQENISKETDIYTIPEDEVQIYDQDLAVYYIDSSMEIFRKRKQHKLATAEWKYFLRDYRFHQTNSQWEAQTTIDKLVAIHLPKLKLLAEK